MFSTFFSVSLENRAVYEIIWKNVVERRRPQMTIWRMRISCWIPSALPLQQWLQERASMLRYRYIACLIYINKVEIV